MLYIRSALADLESHYNNVAEAMINDAAWSMVIPGVKMGTEDEDQDPTAKAKVGILLVGGLRGSQPIGRELLLRFARHLGEGYKQGDNIVSMLLTVADIYILPGVDMEGFTAAEEGQCRSDKRDEAGSMFKQSSNKATEALKNFMSRFDISLALSVESGGVFLRTPFDEVINQEDSTDIDNVLIMMATVYGKNHPNINNNTNMCHDNLTGNVRGSSIKTRSYAGSFLDYSIIKHNIPAIAAHVSCCDFPRHKDIKKLYQDNLEPLKKFLSLSFQGIE